MPKKVLSLEVVNIFKLQKGNKKRAIVLGGQKAAVELIEEILKKKGWYVKREIYTKGDSSNALVVTFSSNGLEFVYVGGRDVINARALFKTVHELGLITDEEYASKKRQYPLATDDCCSCLPEKGSWKAVALISATFVSTLCLAGSIVALELTKDRTDQAGKEHYTRALLTALGTGCTSLTFAAYSSKAALGYLKDGCRKIGTFLTDSQQAQQRNNTIEV